MKALLRRLHAPVYEKRLEVLCELLGQHLEKGETLLDVGCGSGRLAAQLANHHGVSAEGLETHPRDEGLWVTCPKRGGRRGGLNNHPTMPTIHLHRTQPCSTVPI